MVRIAGLVSREEGLRALRGRGRTLSSSSGMNKTEASYARHLETLRRAGLLVAYQFEGEKLRLALRTFLTPDFVVVCLDGSVEYHEVKGRKGKRFYAREDAMLKLKVAADRYRGRRFLVVWPDGAGGWRQELVRSAEGVE
jgi:hypothetical protein